MTVRCASTAAASRTAHWPLQRSHPGKKNPANAGLSVACLLEGIFVVSYAVALKLCGIDGQSSRIPKPALVLLESNTSLACFGGTADAGPLCACYPSNARAKLCVILTDVTCCVAGVSQV